MLKGHIRLWLETNAGAENVGESATLLSQCIDDRSSWRGQWSLKVVSTQNLSEKSENTHLEHVAEHTEHAMKSLVVLRSSLAIINLPSDTSHHLGNHN